MEYVQAVDHMESNWLHVNEMQALTLHQHPSQMGQGPLELRQVSVYFRLAKWMGRCYAPKIRHECIERQQPLRHFLVRKHGSKGRSFVFPDKTRFLTSEDADPGLQSLMISMIRLR